MARKDCEVCKNGSYSVPIILADNEDGMEVVWATYCPECGRRLAD